jgi:hypothetical protein
VIRIDENQFKYILRYPSPTLEYLNNINFPFTQQIKNFPEWHGVRLGHYAQFFHNYEISKFIGDNKLEYDILVKSRCDLVFDKNFNFDFSVDMCYVPEIYWGSKGVGINDHFICGKFSYVNKSLKMESFTEFFNIIESSWNPETANQKLIINNGSKYFEFSCTSYKLLPDRKMK